MSFSSEKKTDVIVIDDDEVSLPERPHAPEALGYCYFCRKETIASGISQCGHCGRTYHKGCISFCRPQGLCAECQRWCGRCIKPLSDSPVRCPRCALSYHAACEPIMGLFRMQQVCQPCIAEVMGQMDGIEARYDSRDISGQRFSIVKLRGMSYLHLTYLPEVMCQSIPRTEGRPPAYVYKDIVKWKECNGERMGLVSFQNRPDSESAWEYEFVTKVLRSEQYVFEEWMCLDLIPGAKVPQASQQYIVEKAQDLILSFGFDPEATDAVRTAYFPRRYEQMKLLDEGIDYATLLQELPNVLSQACLHFNTGPEVNYKGASVRVKDVFFRNIELLLIRNCLRDVDGGRKPALSSSETYKASFADFKVWSATHDLQLLKAVHTVGFGKWKEVLGTLGADATEVYKQVYGEESVLDAAAQTQKLEGFVEQRGRFLIYCLMEDEYLYCESR